jgi:hypothetical protein
MGGACLGAGTTTGRWGGWAAGFSTDAGDAAATGGAAGLAGAAGAAGLVTAAGRGGAGGCSCSCCRCFSSFITSPGLEIFERSSFGLSSDETAFSLEVEPLAEKCFLIFSASSGSTELE